MTWIGLSRSWRLRDWGFAGRLTAIALVPALLMLLAVDFSLYLLARNEVAVDLRERGRLLATALSKSSQYALTSGQLDAIERTAQGLLDGDPSIVSIQVFDAAGKRLLSLRSPLAGEDVETFEVPVDAASVDVNLFDSASAPHLSFEAGSRSPSRANPSAGLVRVVMTSEPMLAKKRDRLLLGSALVLLAALLSGWLGVKVGERLLRAPLAEAMTALRRMRQGRYDATFDGLAAGELRELQDTIVELGQALVVTQQRLEGMVSSRTLQLESAVRSAEAADAERRHLIARGNDRIEEERRRISIDLHDHLNATLIPIKLQAGLLASLVAEGGSDEVRHTARRIEALADDLYVGARDLARHLRPEIIDALGLAGAIEEMVRHLNAIHPDCRFEFRVEGAIPHVPEPQAIVSYRIAQEALSNVVKHARATRCQVILEPMSNLAGLRLSIVDDGAGFDPSRSPVPGIGLLGIRERIAAIGGSLSIESMVGKGTAMMVQLLLPI